MYSLQRFGVTAPQDFYSKYLAQGSWSRCLQCQRDAGVDVASMPAEPRPESSDARTVKQNQNEVCRICAEKFPNDACTADMHRCSARQKEYPAKTWEKNIMKKTQAIPEENARVRQLRWEWLHGQRCEHLLV